MTHKALFLSIICAFSYAHTEESTAFVPQTFTMSYTIQPKDTTNATDLQDTFQNVFETVKKSSNTGSLYQNLVTLIQCAQAAINAGLNIFGTISTTQESKQEIIEEIIEAVIDAELNTATTAEDSAKKADVINDVNPASTTDDTATTVNTDDEVAANNEETSAESVEESNVNDNTTTAPETVTPSLFTISISITVSRQEDLALFEAAKESLIALAQDSNNSFALPKELETFINLNGSGMLSVTEYREETAEATTPSIEA